MMVAEETRLPTAVSDTRVPIASGPQARSSLPNIGSLATECSPFNLHQGLKSASSQSEESQTENHPEMGVGQKVSGKRRSDDPADIQHGSVAGQRSGQFVRTNFIEEDVSSRRLHSSGQFSSKNHQGNHQEALMGVKGEGYEHRHKSGGEVDDSQQKPAVVTIGQHPRGYTYKGYR